MNTGSLPLDGQGVQIPQDFLNHMHDKAHEAGDSLILFQDYKVPYTAGYKAGGIAAYRYLKPQLTDKERTMIAFALFSMGMRMGPSSFEDFESIFKKIGIEKEFVDCARSWIDYPKEKSPSVGDVIGESEL
jgi:hypothetical protein